MRTFKRIVNSQMARGSAIIFIGSNIGNFINLLFNISMGRLLGPEKYGELGALFSSSVLLGVILGILSLFTVKAVSTYWGKKDLGKILAFHKFLTPRLFLLSFVICVTLLVITPLISGFLYLDSLAPFILVALSFVLSGPATFNKGILQGVLAFSYVTVNGVVEVTLKLIISVMLVILNFGLLGPVLGALLGGIVGYILTVVELKIIFRGVTHKKNSPVSWDLLKSFFPVTLASLTLAVF